MKPVIIILLALFTIPGMAAEVSSSTKRAVDKFQKELADLEAKKAKALATVERTLERQIKTAERKNDDAQVEELRRILEECRALGAPTMTEGLDNNNILADVVTMRQAQAISKAIIDNKMSADMWERQPGYVFDVTKLNHTTELTMLAGSQWLIIPHPTDEHGPFLPKKQVSEMPVGTWNSMRERGQWVALAVDEKGENEIVKTQETLIISATNDGVFTLRRPIPKVNKLQGSLRVKLVLIK